MTPTQLVIIISSHSSKVLARQALPFVDLRMVTRNDVGFVVDTYSALADKRWRRLHAVFIPWPPIVYLNSKGGVTGARIDLWKLIGEKVGFSMSFSQKKSYSEMYNLLANGTADIALPDDSMDGNMLQVNCFLRLTDG